MHSYGCRYLGTNAITFVAADALSTLTQLTTLSVSSAVCMSFTGPQRPVVQHDRRTGPSHVRLQHRIANAVCRCSRCRARSLAAQTAELQRNRRLGYWHVRDADAAAGAVWHSHQLHVTESVAARWDTTPSRAFTAHSSSKTPHSPCSCLRGSLRLAAQPTSVDSDLSSNQLDEIRNGTFSHAPLLQVMFEWLCIHHRASPSPQQPVGQQHLRHPGWAVQQLIRAATPVGRPVAFARLTVQ